MTAQKTKQQAKTSAYLQGCTTFGADPFAVKGGKSRGKGKESVASQEQHVGAKGKGKTRSAQDRTSDWDPSQKNTGGNLLLWVKLPSQTNVPSVLGWAGLIPFGLAALGTHSGIDALVLYGFLGGQSLRNARASEPLHEQ